MNDIFNLLGLLGTSIFLFIGAIGLIFGFIYYLEKRGQGNYEKKRKEEDKIRYAKENKLTQIELKNAQKRLENYYNSNLISKEQFDTIDKVYLFIVDQYGSPKFREYQFSDALKEAEEEYSKIKKNDSIIKKYGSEVADKIFSHKYWIGMSVTQLIESLGEPSKIKREETLSEQKIRYCYGSSLELTNENNLVVKIVEK